MPVGGAGSLLDPNILIGLSKITVLILLSFYAIFAIMIVRQVSLMSTTLTTTVSTLLKDLAFYHVIFSLILIFIVWRFL